MHDASERHEDYSMLGTHMLDKLELAPLMTYVFQTKLRLALEYQGFFNVALDFRVVIKLLDIPYSIIAEKSRDWLLASNMQIAVKTPGIASYSNDLTCKAIRPDSDSPMSPRCRSSVHIPLSPHMVMGVTPCLVFPRAAVHLPAI
jgi:hypothetical protein